MRTKRVLHVLDHIEHGGAQQIVREVFENQKDNRNIFCFVLRADKHTKRVDHPNVYFCEGHSKLSLSPLSELKKYVKDNDIDTLHCHLLRSQLFGWLIKKKDTQKIKLVFHEHGRILARKWYFVKFFQLCKKKVDLFIAVSETAKQKLTEYTGIPENKIRVLYNFVDLSRFKRAGTDEIVRQKNKLGINDGDFVVGFVGRFDPIKSLTTLVKALPKLNDNIKLLLIGGGSEKDKLEQLSKDLSVRDRIILPGFVSNHGEIPIMYSTMDVFVLCSRSEASPMTFYESQAMGIPMVASNVPALNEFVIDGYNGVLFEFNNEGQLTSKINNLEKDKHLMAKLSQNCKENAKKYSLEVFLNQLSKVYD